MERISLPPNRETLPLYEDVATNPAPPHEVEGHYFDEMQGDRPFNDKMGASGSKLSHTELSPICSLSEDRLHVSMRLGPVPAEPKATITLPMGPPPKRSGRIAAKVLGKRKPPTQTAEKRVDTSPDLFLLNQRLLSLSLWALLLNDLAESQLKSWESENPLLKQQRNESTPAPSREQALRDEGSQKFRARPKES
ncbi:hypothetical protein F2Q69_00047407 [Brassica cretica]|uniref:Uncharacterized protein n=1 Tax=Brassica cretica TaxID=69181 RepID=A0A8S9PJB8_BRACR|nr:hypothetical protein F2Q69_00047407 [Brassica cretica]